MTITCTPYAFCENRGNYFASSISPGRHVGWNSLEKGGASSACPDDGAVGVIADGQSTPLSWLTRAEAPTPSIIQATFFTGGTFQDPSIIEGSLSPGQYMRSIRMNRPEGAGNNQFDSLSAPGESF
jgi:hypothetical protein